MDCEGLGLDTVNELSTSHELRLCPRADERCSVSLNLVHSNFVEIERKHSGRERTVIRCGFLFQISFSTGLPEPNLREV